MQEAGYRPRGGEGPSLPTPRVPSPARLGHTQVQPSRPLSVKGALREPGCSEEGLEAARSVSLPSVTGEIQETEAPAAFSGERSLGHLPRECTSWGLAALVPTEPLGNR